MFVGPSRGNVSVTEFHSVEYCTMQFVSPGQLRTMICGSLVAAAAEITESSTDIPQIFINATFVQVVLRINPNPTMAPAHGDVSIPLPRLRLFAGFECHRSSCPWAHRSSLFHRGPVSTKRRERLPRPFQLHGFEAELHFISFAISTQTATRSSVTRPIMILMTVCHGSGMTVWSTGLFLWHAVATHKNEKPHGSAREAKTLNDR